jgi:hypothetical protein
MTALVSLLFLKVVAALRRVATIYGLMALGGLIVIFAIGYLVDAGHVLLAAQYGPAAASLIVAGAFLLVAAACFVLAHAMRTRPSRPRPSQAAPPRGIRTEWAMGLRRLRAVLAALAGAAGAGLLAMGFARRRRSRSKRVGRRGLFS